MSTLSPRQNRLLCVETIYKGYIFGDMSVCLSLSLSVCLCLSLCLSLSLTHTHTHTQVLDGALALIDGSRRGDTVNRQQLRELTSMFMEVGAVSHDGGAAVYEKVFNAGFLDHTRDYYNNLAQKNQAEMDPFSYVEPAATTVALT